MKSHKKLSYPIFQNSNYRVKSLTQPISLFQSKLNFLSIFIFLCFVYTPTSNATLLCTEIDGIEIDLIDFIGEIEEFLAAVEESIHKDIKEKMDDELEELLQDLLDEEIENYDEEIDIVEEALKFKKIEMEFDYNETFIFTPGVKKSHKFSSPKKLNFELKRKNSGEIEIELVPLSLVPFSMFDVNGETVGTVNNLKIHTVPAPLTLWMYSVGLLGIAFSRWRALLRP